MFTTTEASSYWRIFELKIEEVINDLREGHAIYRNCNPNEQLRIEENGLRSFYLTIYDLIATDWEVQYDLFIGKNHE